MRFLFQDLFIWKSNMWLFKIYKLYCCFTSFLTLVSWIFSRAYKNKVVLSIRFIVQSTLWPFMFIFLDSLQGTRSHEFIFYFGHVTLQSKELVKVKGQYLLKNVCFFAILKRFMRLCYIWPNSLQAFTTSNSILIQMRQSFF